MAVSVPAPVPASPLRPPALGPAEVHLWHSDLEDPTDPPGGETLLSEDERGRADRMAPTPRRRFVRSRCLLRTVLGGYLTRDPAGLRFDLTGEGKPGLANAGRPALQFNLTHAQRRWLLAVSREVVGVDLERSDRQVDIEGVAPRIFRPEEVAAILALEGDRRRQAFFRAWTGREALVKASGEGIFTLSLPAPIDVHPDRPLAVTGPRVGSWKLVEVPLSGPWQGALAVQGELERVSAFTVALATESPE